MSEAPILGSEFLVPSDGDVMLHQRRWYAAYVCVRHEKRVAEYLQWGGLDCYLPIYRSTRTWNKRRVEVDLPLFPGYVFVRIALTERLRVLSAPSVVHLVGRGAEPLPLNDAEVDAIRGCLLPQFQAEPAEYLPMGSRVRVVAGPLRGLEGVVVRDNGRARFIVSIDLIMRSIAVNVEGCDLALATPAASRGN